MTANGADNRQNAVVQARPSRGLGILADCREIVTRAAEISYRDLRRDSHDGRDSRPTI